MAALSCRADGQAGVPLENYCPQISQIFTDLKEWALPQNPCISEICGLFFHLLNLKKLSPVYDPECPPSTPEALAEFAAMARELRKNHRNPAPVVALRLMPDVLAKYNYLS